MKEVTRKVAEFILETKFDAVARDALEMAKIHILDTVGCILAGSQEEAANIIANYLCDIGGGGTSTIIPSGMRTTAPYAALANGVSGHVLDYDDYEWPSMAHPSVTVLPAVFALGEKTHASGKDCLEAYLIGIEVISKIGTGINPNHYDKGWHSTSTLGTLGAASASSKLLELDAEKTLQKINECNELKEEIQDFSFIGKITKIALPADAKILAVSPNDDKILLRHKERDFKDETQSDLWILDVTKDRELLENEIKIKESLFCLTQKLDEEPSEVQWTKSGIYLAYWNESTFELAKFEETGEFEKINLGNLSIKFFFNFNDYGNFSFSAFSSDLLEEMFHGKKTEDGLIIEKITNVNDRYSNWDFGSVESVRWKSKDGVEIEGILRKPSNFDPTKKYPLLLFIHGGPAATSPLALVFGADRNFYPTIQLCNKGVIILSPNYRGSVGRGQWFKELNFDNLGVGDLWDIESGIDFLIEQGFIDETRIGCMGSSQGGYISAFTGMHSDRFKAVSVGSCAASWYTYYITSDVRDSILLAGEPFSEEREASIKKTAPISAINKTKTPILLQHGKNDQRTGIASANEIFRALKQKGIHTEFFMYNDASHGFDYPRDYYGLMLQNLRWFSHYLLDEELDFFKDDF